MLSQGTVVTWYWDFGDGSPYEYTSAVSHTFTKASTVTLMVGDTSGFTAIQKIRIHLDAIKPSTINYNWDFGDGFSGTGVSAVHIYKRITPVFATLNQTDSLGQSGTMKGFINISPVYYWDFGDGTIQLYQGESADSHIYNQSSLTRLLNGFGDVPYSQYITIQNPQPIINVRFDNITTINTDDGTKHFYYKDLVTNKKNWAKYFPPNIR
jgi:hypothetical protein